MRIECNLCHAIAEMGQTAVSPGGMEVRCAACGRWFHVASGTADGAPASVDARVGSGPYRTLGAGPGCPKCGRARGAGHDACPRCGLVYALWPADAPPAIVLDERGADLWAAAERGWSDPARHDQFLHHCSTAGLLGGAGRMYRERLDRNPGDAIAVKMQKRVLNMASQLMGPHTSALPPLTRSRWFGVVLALSVVGGVVAALLAG